MNDWLLNMIRCPITGQSLELASVDLVTGLREQAQAGTLTSHKGLAIPPAFEGGLVNQSRTYFYRIQDGIPSLLPDEAIALNAEPHGASRGSS